MVKVVLNMKLTYIKYKGITLSQNISATPLVSDCSLTSTVPQSLAAADIQTLTQEIANLKEENLKLKENLRLKNALSQQEFLKKQPFGFFSIENNNDHIMHYTRLPNKEIFNIIFSNCDKVLDTYYEEWNATCLDRKDQLSVTLMKLKLNHTHIDLGVRFQVSEGIAGWLLTTLILCSKTQKKMSHQRLFYSSYKHRHTMKALIGVAPNGVITYTIEMYPGSTSDKELSKNCNVNNAFQPGDLVADKGFLISDVLPDGVAVNIHPHPNH
ncbi:uncharacterized protein [Parasteatoda tepidariorum]|uniref:uncharacterized protein n=1 Tax=Parasteatoda tepidariorum TaxID=114398 RepID=UPI0039BC4D0D